MKGGGPPHGLYHRPSIENNRFAYQGTGMNADLLAAWGFLPPSRRRKNSLNPFAAHCICLDWTISQKNVRFSFGYTPRHSRHFNRRSGGTCTTEIAATYIPAATCDDLGERLPAGPIANSP